MGKDQWKNYVNQVLTIKLELGKALGRRQNHVAAFVKCETRSLWISLFFKMPVLSLTEKKSSYIQVNITANNFYKYM